MNHEELTFGVAELQMEKSGMGSGCAPRLLEVWRDHIGGIVASKTGVASMPGNYNGILPLTSAAARP